MAKKILVIEDQKDLVKLLASRIKTAGYEVFTALDGQAGLEEVRRCNPDLVITDLALPAMPGNALVRVLKASAKYRHIPIIMLSAFVDERMKDGVEIPADFYMPKPYQADLLIGKIKELIGDHHGAASA